MREPARPMDWMLLHTPRRTNDAHAGILTAAAVRLGYMLRVRSTRSNIFAKETCAHGGKSVHLAHRRSGSHICGIVSGNGGGVTTCVFRAAGGGEVGPSFTAISAGSGDEELDVEVDDALRVTTGLGRGSLRTFSTERNWWVAKASRSRSRLAASLKSHCRASSSSASRRYPICCLDSIAIQRVRDQIRYPAAIRMD